VVSVDVLIVLDSATITRGEWRAVSEILFRSEIDFKLIIKQGHKILFRLEIL